MFKTVPPQKIGLLTRTIFIICFPYRTVSTATATLWPRQSVPLALFPGKLAPCPSRLLAIKTVLLWGRAGPRRRRGAYWKWDCKTLWWCANQKQPEKKRSLLCITCAHAHTNTLARPCAHTHTHTHSSALCQVPSLWLGRGCVSYISRLKRMIYLVRLQNRADATVLAQ